MKKITVSSELSRTGAGRSAGGKDGSERVRSPDEEHHSERDGCRRHAGDLRVPSSGALPEMESGAPLQVEQPSNPPAMKEVPTLLEKTRQTSYQSPRFLLLGW